MAEQETPIAPARGDSFWKRYRDFIIAIVVLGAIFAFLVVRDRNESNVQQDTEQTATEEQAASPSQGSMDEKMDENKSARMEEDRITVTASRGEGYTHLARKALAEYLEQNRDEGDKITREHKVYIEDLLQKQVPNKQKLRVGSEHTFTTDEIESAVEKADDLTSGQLENLKKFSSRVTNL